MRTIASFDVGTKNLAYCVVVAGDGAASVREWEVLQVGPGAPGVLEALDARGDAWRGCETVVIERQPNRNRAMLAVQAYLEMYFAVKGVRTVLYSARRKLQGTGFDQQLRGREHYRHRKQAAVALVQAYLPAADVVPAARAVFEGSKKKDDLSDCLLQALSFLRVPVACPAQVECLPTTKVRARQPTARQAATGQYSASNVKFLLQQLSPEAPITDPALLRAIAKLFGSVHDCRAQLFP